MAFTPDPGVFGAPAKVDDSTVDSALAAIRNAGYALPRDYESFLRQRPETSMFPGEVHVSAAKPSPWATDGWETIGFLYGCIPSALGSVLDETFVYRSELPAGYLVIGEAQPVAPLVMNTRGLAPGKIYVWDRTGPTDRLGRDQFFSTASTFTALMKGLRLAPPLAQGSAGPRVVSSSISPDLQAAMDAFLANEDQRK